MTDINNDITKSILLYYLNYTYIYNQKIKKQIYYDYIFNKNPEERLDEDKKMKKNLSKARNYEKINKYFKNP